MVKSSDYSVNILVNGNIVREYFDDGGQLWVEGRPGSEWTLRIQNWTGRRLLAVVSVDGLSVMDGKPAKGTPDDGYIVPAHGKFDIPGWRLNNSAVAKFKFGKKGDSYAVASGVDAQGENVGVIGVALYREKEVLTWASIYNPHHAYGHPWTCHCPVCEASWVYRNAPVTICDSVSSDGVNTTVSNGSSPQNLGVTYTAHGDVGDAVNSVLQNTCLYSATLDAPRSSTEKQYCATGPIPVVDKRRSAIRSLSVEQKVGTEFGRQQKHEVVSVSFEAESAPDLLFTMRYDTFDNLKKRGVIVEKPVQSSPNPFPAGGCVPPPGWRK